MRKILLLIACVLVLPVAANADMSKPPELAAIIHSDTAYGQGAYKKLWFKAYDASLWTDAAQWSMQSKFALSLRYGMHFDAADIIKRSIEEMQHVDPMPDATAQQYSKELGAIFPDVNDGDVITAVFTPDKGIKFYYNGKAAGTVADTMFAKRFMDIWLSPNTSAPDLRNQLLNQ